MTELSTPSGEAFEAFIDGNEPEDCPYPSGTVQNSQWLLTTAQLWKTAAEGNVGLVSELREEIKSLMEQMG
jgi:hypothetical protein